MEDPISHKKVKEGLFDNVPLSGSLSEVRERAIMTGKSEEGVYLGNCKLGSSV